MKTQTRPSGELFGTGSFPARDTTRDLEALNEELAVVSDIDLETSIVALKQHMDASHAEWLLRIAEYDRRGIADVRHGLTTTGWLRRAVRVTGRLASQWVRRARGLVHMPTVAANAVKGTVSENAIGQLDQARRRHRDEFPAHEPVFADIATYLDATELRQAIGYWEQQIDYPTAVERTRNQRRRRRLSINQLFDGMWAINGELDPESGALVNKAIETVSRAGYLDRDDMRAPWQIRADAITDICERSLRKGTTTSKGVKPHVTVTVDTETLLGLESGFATIEDAAIPPETLQRIVCDASIVRILTTNSGTPIDVGRATRVVSPALRRALDARDRGCQWSGCDAPPDWCDAHHVISWHVGGPTELDNLTLLCRTHHTRTHETTDRHTPETRKHPTRAP